MRLRTCLLIGLLGILLPLKIGANKIFDKSARKQMTVWLNDDCQWLVSSEAKREVTTPGSVPVDPMVTEATIARALAVGYELTKDNPQYSQESLRRCETLLGLQETVKTSKGNDGGCWLGPADHHDDLDLGVNGIIAGALTRVSADADSPLKSRILGVVEKYALLVLEGCAQDPLNKGRNGAAGWIIQDGEQKGAMGAGYLKDHVSRKPSTLATAANAAFFAQLFSITHKAQYQSLAREAVRWLLARQSAVGFFPTLLDGIDTGEASMDTMTAGTEAVLAVDYLCAESSLKQQIHTDIEPVARWLLRTQNEKGLWGSKQDQRGSTGAVTLLAWFYLAGAKDEAFPQALDKAWQVLTNPVHAQSFGVQISPFTTALMALTTAEMIKPGISFRKS